MTPEHALGEAIWDLANDWYDADCAYGAGMTDDIKLQGCEAALLEAIQEFITDQRHP